MRCRASQAPTPAFRFPGERARTALGRVFRRHPGQGSERQVLRGHSAVRPVLFISPIDLSC